jgi:hypothetical protein
MIKMSKQLEYLCESCKEALETKSKQLNVTPLKLQEQLQVVSKFDPTSFGDDKLLELFEQHRKEFLEGDRSWLIGANITINGLDVSYCFKLAEEQDHDLTGIILYRIYRAIEVSGVLEGEDLQTIKNRATTIKSMLDGNSTAGPSGLEFGALQQNLGGIMQNIVPMFESLMQSPEFKKVISKAIPQDAQTSNNPPDISSVIKNTLGVFESQEGKELFSKITDILPMTKK